MTPESIGQIFFKQAVPACSLAYLPTYLHAAQEDPAKHRQPARNGIRRAGI